MDFSVVGIYFFREGCQLFKPVSRIMTPKKKRKREKKGKKGKKREKQRKGKKANLYLSSVGVAAHHYGDGEVLHEVGQCAQFAREHKVKQGP